MISERVPGLGTSGVVGRGDEDCAEERRAWKQTQLNRAPIDEGVHDFVHQFREFVIAIWLSPGRQGLALLTIGTILSNLRHRRGAGRPQCVEPAVLRSDFGAKFSRVRAPALSLRSHCRRPPRPQCCASLASGNDQAQITGVADARSLRRVAEARCVCPTRRGRRNRYQSGPAHSRRRPPPYRAFR